MEAPSFPVAGSRNAHGSLLIDGDGVPWIYVKDHVTPTQVFEFILNLRTGRQGTPGQVAAHSRWELVVFGEDGKPGPVLARFG